jgi:heme-degrading monooxygenase HmoA
MYVIIWKFTVRPGLESEFEAAYGPEGVWAQYFRRGPGYIETELLRDTIVPRQYFTIDRWVSQSAFDNFQARFAAGYKAIDEECEALTESELKIGSFELAGAHGHPAESHNDDES